MKVLAIDFGEERIGLAISDAAGTLALPLTTIRRESDRQAISRIHDIARREGIEMFVVGDPRNMDGTRGESTLRAESFSRKLESATGLSCVLVDETLTSEAAKERLVEAGVDLRRHRERIDAVAAQILLEEFLSRGYGEPADG
ncbi:MAG: Holliday junction resolvase RuvX [Acidobacteriota bacterium]